MSNERFIADIVNRAQKLGLESQLFETVQTLIETGHFDRVTAYSNAIKILQHED
jgi:hypothetical protein